MDTLDMVFQLVELLLDVASGVSPGASVINCGMRLVVTNPTYSEVKPYIKVVDKL